MSYNCNLSGKIIIVPECVDIVTKYVEHINIYSSKFKAIYLICDNVRYDFPDEVFFSEPTSITTGDNDNCSEVTLKNKLIKKVYKTQIPCILTPGRYELIKIIIEECEYVQNGKTLKDSPYEIPIIFER